jgi:hypothetical protein
MIALDPFITSLPYILHPNLPKNSDEDFSSKRIKYHTGSQDLFENK